MAPKQHDSITLYEAAIRPPEHTALKVAGWAWTAIGLAGLLAFAWSEPWSQRCIDAAIAAGWPAWLMGGVVKCLVMALRGVIVVEVFGYLYHRFFQHLGFLTRRAQVFRRNQMFHWMHHMIIYPIGRFYRRSVAYVSSEQGIAWSWVAPGVVACAAAVLEKGFNLPTVVFLASIGLYAKYVIDVAHSRFHEVDHPWAKSEYFQWLEKIHILHHWDQRYNFQIIHPAMDWLFGTYIAPATHPRELATALDDKELTVSDLINWRYLLIEASPAEYASFISQAKRHPRSLRKFAKLIDVLKLRLDLYPNDALARTLLQRAEELGAIVLPAPAAA